MVCGVLISVAAVGVVPGGEAMQKCDRYFADFADLATKMHSDSLWFP